MLPQRLVGTCKNKETVSHSKADFADNEFLFPILNFKEKDLQQAGGVLPERQMLEEPMEECVRFYEIWNGELEFIHRTQGSRMRFPERQMLEELMDERVRLYEVWNWSIPRKGHQESGCLSPEGQRLISQA